MRPLALPLLFALLLPIACAGEEEVPGDDAWVEVGTKAMDEAAAARQRRASQARDALFGRLSGRLVEAMEEGGPAGAITVCKEVAPALAREVAEKHDLRIGRTSFRLRNPENVPPAWAEPYVQARVEDDVWLVHPEKGLRALLPIGLQPRCVACHGPEEALPAAVRERLETSYPEDEATGFEAGELRGWFWVEVP